MVEGDTHKAKITRPLGIATQAALPRNRKPLPRPEPSDLSSIGPFACRFFGELFDRISSRPFLVFDAWEKAIPGSSVEAAVREGIHLFTEVHPGDEPVYEFHPLFREFLLHHAEGDPRMVVGTVEQVGEKMKIGFTDFEELRLILGVPRGQVTRRDAPTPRGDEG